MVEVNGRTFIEYREIPNAETPVWTLTVGDLQIEAQERLGRLLDSNEISRAEEILEYGFGETISSLYDGFFEVLQEENMTVLDIKD